MKWYYIFLAVMAYLMSSCEQSPNITDSRIIATSHGYNISAREINGHTYYRMGHGFTHAGDCPKCKIELEDMLRRIINEKSSW